MSSSSSSLTSSITLPGRDFRGQVGCFAAFEVSFFASFLPDFALSIEASKASIHSSVTFLSCTRRHREEPQSFSAGHSH
jgi:hypothetical protein